MVTESLPPLLLVFLFGVVALALQRRLRHALARAAEAERLAASRGRCLAMAAQEIRGPALSLLGAADRLMRERPEEAAATDAAAHALLRLSDDLADLAADPVPTRVLREAPVVLGPVVTAAVETISAQMRPGRRHWQVDPALHDLTVHADRRALQGAIAALLRRAARHSRDGDVIGLRCVLADETLSIVVEDEGDGLPVLDLGLAEPAQGTRGLDLGLTLARSLAAAHGGDLKLETAPGIGGARAWLTLPRTRLLELA